MQSIDVTQLVLKKDYFFVCFLVPLRAHLLFRTGFIRICGDFFLFQFFAGIRE